LKALAASFLALYRGDAIAAAKMVAISAQAKLVREFAARGVSAQPCEPEQDVVLRELEGGRRNALRAVRDEKDE
jgi:hypothetical protein